MSSLDVCANRKHNLTFSFRLVVDSEFPHKSTSHVFQDI